MDLEGYDYGKLKEVGKISYEALQYSKTIVREGASLLDVAERVEKFVKEKGFGMAFPVNLSINHLAAHYTPEADDKRVFAGNDLIKIDVGARRDFYLGDCALTIDLSNSHSRLVDASEEALSAAISVVKAGREVREIGREIEKAAKAKGATPIRNLGGHGIEETELHSGIFIPNYDNGDNTRLEEGQVIAIEPFMTDGSGLVQDGDITEIFQKSTDATPRSREAREAASLIGKEYKTYPFASRWLHNELAGLGDFKVRKALSELTYIGAIKPYPILVERKKGMVAQAEKEMIVEKDSCTVVTK